MPPVGCAPTGSYRVPPAAYVTHHATADRCQRAVIRRRHRRGTRMNQSWSSGYVADVPYREGSCVQQAPARMVLSCLLLGVVAELPAPSDAACYIELGCGVGIGALVTAASNPGWKVVAIDYNPA